MSALVTLVLAHTDPLTSLLVVLLGVYVRSKMQDLAREVDRLRGRVGRVEDVYIPDGGQPDE